jgi:hypothetical protein
MGVGLKQYGMRSFISGTQQLEWQGRRLQPARRHKETGEGQQRRHSPSVNRVSGIGGHNRNGTERRPANGQWMKWCVHAAEGKDRHVLVKWTSRKKNPQEAAQAALEWMQRVWQYGAAALQRALGWGAVARSVDKRSGAH